VLGARGLAGAATDDGAVAVEARDGRFLEALDALRAGGVGVRSVEMQRPTLEEVFLAAVRADADAKP